jgi:hypothetical protein
MKRFMPLLLVTTVLSACGSIRAPLAPSAQSAETLKATAETLTVNNQVLTVQGAAWISNSQGNPNPFIVSVKVQNAGGSVPAGVSPEKLYIVKGNEVWETKFTNEYRGPNAPEWEKVARTSTVFPAGTRLTLVVQVETAEGDRMVRVAGEQEVTMPN